MKKASLIAASMVGLVLIGVFVGFMIGRRGPTGADTSTLRPSPVALSGPDGVASVLLPGTTLDLGGGVTMKLALIPAGKFMMGSPANETDRDNDEGPQRQVTISKPLYMGVFEVTQAQWKAVMGTEPWKGKENARENPDHAASYISWNDATEFCRRLSQRTGRTVRLPTEAEWEYACRAGSTTRFYYGDDPDYRQLGEYAWFLKNAWDVGNKYAHPVGRKKPNAFGLYDMHGNVWEWCSDWSAESYANANAVDPTGPASGSFRVLRGGMFSYFGGICRSAYRGGGDPGYVWLSHGLRVAVSSGPGL